MSFRSFIENTSVMLDFFAFLVVECLIIRYFAFVEWSVCETLHISIPKTRKFCLIGVKLDLLQAVVLMQGQISNSSTRWSKKKTAYKNIFPRRNNRHVMALAQTCPTTCRDHVVDPKMGSAAVEGCKLLFFFCLIHLIKDWEPELLT